MQQQESGGAIVNIGSVAARQAEPGSAAYSAAKAGLLQLTRALALEWAPRVRVNHITAGLVMTPTAAPYYGQDGGASVAATIPMGRMAEPSDIASACLFLASPLAAYVTGADLAEHGGGEVPARYLAANPQADRGDVLGGADTSRRRTADVLQSLPGVTPAGLDPGRHGAADRRRRE